MLRSKVPGSRGGKKEGRKKATRIGDLSCHTEREAHRTFAAFAARRLMAGLTGALLLPSLILGLDKSLFEIVSC